MKSNSRAPIRRRMALVSMLLAFATAGPARAETNYTCGGSAPIQTFCTTGNHTRVLDISQDVAADISYVGTIETTLVWNGGQRIFRCTYATGTERVCYGLGSFPPVNYSFTHQCRSIIPSSAQPGTPANGVQGGIGTWSCSVFV